LLGTGKEKMNLVQAWVTGGLGKRLMLTRVDNPRSKRVSSNNLRME